MKRGNTLRNNNILYKYLYSKKKILISTSLRITASPLKNSRKSFSPVPENLNDPLNLGPLRPTIFSDSLNISLRPHARRYSSCHFFCRHNTHMHTQHSSDKSAVLAPSQPIRAPPGGGRPGTEAAAASFIQCGRHPPARARCRS